MNFDPSQGQPFDCASAFEVFPDARELITKSAQEYGECDEYRYVLVPNTDSVYILYGIRDTDKTVVVVNIRTHTRGIN